jgi:hypothetical protein
VSNEAPMGACMLEGVSREVLMGVINLLVVKG